MRKALAAIDESTISKELISYAFRYASLEQLDGLTFFHVINQPHFSKDLHYSYTLPDEDDLINRATSRFTGIIEEEREKSDAAVCPYQLHVRVGTAYHKIIEEARKPEYEIILIGHRGLNDIEEFFIGSVASKVVRHAPCSVLVYHPRLTFHPSEEPQT
ncbi:MAG: universal stress protein [Synergistales bacterium]|nr:universal stress protein [Synergistales bacterium]